MIDDSAVESALKLIREQSGNHAEAKAQRRYLEQFRKSKKALLMNEKDGPQHVRESYAYAHPDYIEVLEGLQAAIEKEEHLFWRLKEAEMRVEIYRTQSANNRRIDSAHA